MTIRTVNVVLTIDQIMYLAGNHRDGPGIVDATIIEQTDDCGGIFVSRANDALDPGTREGAGVWVNRYGGEHHDGPMPESEFVSEVANVLTVEQSYPNPQGLSTDKLIEMLREYQQLDDDDSEEVDGEIVDPAQLIIDHISSVDDTHHD